MSILQDFYSVRHSKLSSTPLETAPDGAGGKITNVGGNLPWKLRSTSQASRDVKHWKRAMEMWETEERPRTYELQLLYDQVMRDAVLTSQIENRINQAFNADFSLRNAAGEEDEEATKKLKKMAVYRQICRSILMSIYRGYSVGEFRIKGGIDGSPIIDFVEIPRANIVPREGLFYRDYLDEESLPYRDLQEYGTWILEFLNGPDEFGLVNKAVPHVLFKKFAESCWSELGEIYGIPPRVLKTNTQDKNMLNRSEKMMRDMGSAAWFIIDKSEEFEFANSTIKTSGQIFKDLIGLCNNENSMLISGAIVGQDTKNGSNAKEKSSQNLLTELVESDLELLEQSWNNMVLPAMVKLGFLPQGLTFQYDPSEDLNELWTRTKDILPYANVDMDWVKEKFGIEVTGMRSGLGFKSKSAERFFD